MMHRQNIIFIVRCSPFFFLYRIVHTDETSKDAEYKLAQSGDATCNGLDSAEVHISR